MAGTPLLTLAEEAMETLIAAMRIADSYNYNWGTVNQKDLAKCKFPCAQIYLDPMEENLDEEGGIHAGAYSNRVYFRIKVIGKMTKETKNPIFDNNVNLNKALDDLKMLFGTNYSIDGTVDTIMYRSAARVERINNDIMIPTELETLWTVNYTQSRTDPTVPDP